ncbi:DUF771 domain-containing protein [Pasteurella atlantica]|uniref:DUF771 domain-containing protein n=2 Tax=Pasteurellaceae TaxID=712 RepID=A0ACC6HPS4_9PAST|nr:DUF771 domain-containing protein [Pasteurella atlantica]MDP8052616.1 DUF771 domain-containing protein [Pasteurella atlantica]MDP8105784.1 DUF771 domain-containing protein [Pasteurella atlantica]MDP8149274.1 DUF771 domain-containing protein [Pasteurella atlantica]
MHNSIFSHRIPNNTKVAKQPTRKTQQQYTQKDNEDTYWSIKDIATYIKQSERTVRRNLLNDPRFPRPIQFGENTSKRWLASEVKVALLLFRK